MWEWTVERSECVADPAVRPQGVRVASDNNGTDRVLTGRGVLNLRDLGGLPTVDGGVVRRGRVYRSDCPRFADGDSDVVRRLGLRTVVDLRRRSEVDFECVRWAEYGADHIVCSLSAGETNSWHAAYAGYLEHRPDRVVSAVRNVLSAADHPVLLHCAAGKDRTAARDDARVPRLARRAWRRRRMVADERSAPKRDRRVPAHSARDLTKLLLNKRSNHSNVPYVTDFTVSFDVEGYARWPNP